MNFTETLKIAVKCTKANWLRSVLTMLGIIIGITSVIMIVGAGTGVRDYIVGLIEDMGSNAVLVSVDATQATALFLHGAVGPTLYACVLLFVFPTPIKCWQRQKLKKHSMQSMV